ncbi:flagellar biosynthetic protein FliO [Paraburkholderia kirstenboschensis]|uniref:Flagellar protein n=1 Tax=Paraburkholderia kirstenboschensis TaxID=1245436 RepID=A0ABZ0EL02_9BURK|nr:flagellar biosynthetic protein FliO [Paraburkholderia kirstenboschensis]WOD17863.1 flagellar biosynthetic protein FliO [Paraburkholderia kirstenboschensis]
MKAAVRRAVFPASRHVSSRAVRAVFAATALFSALCAPLAAYAADMNAVNNAAKIASGVGAGTAVPALGVGAVLQTIVGLLVVIGLVFGCAWLARRFGLQPGSRSGLVKTVGGTSLGGKERVAVIEIGDTWLVLGAAPGNVRLLHTMPAGSVAIETAGNAQAGAPGAAGTTLTGNFGQRFRDALKGEVSKRFNGQGNGVR